MKRLVMRTDNEAQTDAEDPARELLELLKVTGLQEQSEQQLERLQDQINAVCVELITAFNESVVARVEPFLMRMRRAASILVGIAQKDFQRDTSYYLGQLHAIAEIAEKIGRASCRGRV